jgi:hypothetical protein
MSARNQPGDKAIREVTALAFQVRNQEAEVARLTRKAVEADLRTQGLREVLAEVANGLVPIEDGTRFALSQELAYRIKNLVTP